MYELSFSSDVKWNSVLFIFTIRFKLQKSWKTCIYSVKLRKWICRSSIFYNSSYFTLSLITWIVILQKWKISTMNGKALCETYIMKILGINISLIDWFYVVLYSFIMVLRHILLLFFFTKLVKQDIETSQKCIYRSF